jgi:holo-[acyl-carrier protein] synthase
VILGLGMDVVEVGRLARVLDGPPGRVGRFLARVYTPGERAACQGRRDLATCLAARFAAKEAAYKALGGYPASRWVDFEVTRAGGGAPQLVLSGGAAATAAARGVARVHLTLTHDGGFAAATVILEGP